MDPNTFDISRMEALKEFASLEHELCLLLKGALVVEAEIAATIFYQISNTRSRYAIINSVLQIRHEKTYAKAWPRLEKWLGPCDTARNHIIHWGQDVRHVIHTVPREGTDDKSLEDLKFVSVERAHNLKNPAKKWRPVTGGEVLYFEAQIRAETVNIRTMKHIINRFVNCIFRHDDWPWTDIFQQPIAHQTPAEFLSLLNDRGYPALPESSSMK